MFAVERRSRIISLLNEKESVSVQEAARMFNVSEETIRRDLDYLEERNMLTRTHGGAVLPVGSKPEISYELRSRINITGKDRIGRAAAAFVGEGDTIILDASTSAFFVAKHIKNKRNVTVITNAENVITELCAAEGIELISTGGVLRRKSMSYVGSAAETSLAAYHANKLFFSCMGFTFESGLTDSNGQESDMKKIMIERCQKIFFLCDHTKFGRVGYAATAKPEDIDTLITDEEPGPATGEKLRLSGIEVIVAG